MQKAVHVGRGISRNHSAEWFAVQQKVKSINNRHHGVFFTLDLMFNNCYENNIANRVAKFHQLQGRGGWRGMGLAV